MLLCIHDWETTTDEWIDDIHRLTFRFCVKCGKWQGKVETGTSPALKERFRLRMHELAEDASRWMCK